MIITLIIIISANSLAEIVKTNVTVPRGKGKDRSDTDESIVTRKRILEEEEIALQKRVGIY
jgi:hypothetical protein